MSQAAAGPTSVTPGEGVRWRQRRQRLRQRHDARRAVQLPRDRPQR